MIALNGPSELDMLRTRIEIVERQGRFDVADELRRRVAELEAGEHRFEVDDDEPDAFDERCDDALDDEPFTGNVLTVFPTLKRKLVCLWIVELSDFAHWNATRLRKAGFSPHDISLIYRTLGAIGMAGLIGSSDVPDELPEPNPFAVDILDGRTVEDVKGYIKQIAKGVPRRDVSHQMGSPRGWHQRAGSMIVRHNRLLAEEVAVEMLAEHRHEGWLRGTSVTKTGHAWMPWAVLVDISVGPEAAAKTLGIVEKTKYGGFGWRNVRVIFTTGEKELQASVKKLDGRYRVVDETGAPLRKNGTPLDKHARSKRAGYTSQQAAAEHAAGVNARIAREQEKPKTRKQKRAARSAEIRKSREARGGAVHP